MAAAKLGKIIARVSRMSAREIGVRLAQGFHKCADERWPPARETPAGGHSRGRFFFEPGGVAAILKLIPEPERIVSQAEKICRRRFDLLGYEDLDFGAEIDWHLDPVHGKRAPYAPWFRIPYLDFQTVGDHKIVWELNRHQHLVTLAKAHLLTGDPRFLAEIEAQWDAWHERNPYPMGINWASSLEVAFRSLSWIWVDALLGTKLRGDLAAATCYNARYIEKYLSTYFAPNTHLLGEGVALFFTGTLFREFAAAQRWRERGWKIVLNEARRQVQPDGMHFEQSTYYHVYALDFFLHARILAARNGITIPAEFDSTIERMAEALRLRSQGGAAPRFGDDDGGRVFDPRRNRTEHMLDPLATAAAVYGRGDFKAAAGGTREETLWLLGGDTVTAAPRAPASAEYCMVATGPVVREAIIDAGPHGYGAGGHGHADALSLQWIAEGRHWLTDPGTYHYPLELGRNRFRGTAAHNTLIIDGRDQAEPAGPFSWKSAPQTKVERWETGPEFDLFVGSRDQVHRRWVISWKCGLLFVRDIAPGSGTHDLELNWHLGPNGEALTFTAPALPEWTREMVEGEWSPAYGAKIAAQVLRFRARVALPAEFAVMISPGTQDGAVLERLPTGYRYTSPESSIEMVFDDEAIAVRVSEGPRNGTCTSRCAGRPGISQGPKRLESATDRE
jgi:hypothetical protein